MTEIKKRKKKTVVILVANKVQLPFIEFCALQEDIKLITIDNNPDNPGHKMNFYKSSISKIVLG